MTTGILASLVAILTWGFVEGFGRFYPSRPTWRRLRRLRGRRAVRKMRERFADAGDRRTGRKLAIVLLVLVGAWVASASLLDKRWYEVVADALPSLIVILGLLRLPAAFGAIAERMKDYEREAGEDPDKPYDLDPPGGDGGPEALAL
jgi:hypothetical protein